jgi:Zn-dependent peptidase ImmA (M78 family)/transcriptional regulator with XRE-family HTH domain
MTLDPTTLGRRLRQARENRRLTQDQAAKAIGISRTALVHIEAGKRSLSTLELSGLAKLYERPLDDIVREGKAAVSREEDPLLIMHRLPTALVGNPAIEVEVSRCLELCRIGVELETTLGMRHTLSLPSYELRDPVRPAEATRQGERVAEEERRRLGLGYGPVADMADLITTQGIWASGVRNLPDEMSGVFLRHSSIRMVILVNYNHPRPRKRFSYAHEYAHALLDRNNSAIVSTRANSLDLAERRANAFAAAFLLPADGVRWYLDLLEKGSPSRRYRVTYVPASKEGESGELTEAEERPEPGSQEITYQDVASLAHHFGVSYPAAVYRLSDLGFVNANEKTSLIARSDTGSRYMASLARDGYMATEGGEQVTAKVDRDLVSQIVRLAVEAYRREEVSSGWLRDLSGKLDMSADYLLELAEAAASN